MPRLLLGGSFQGLRLSGESLQIGGPLLGYVYESHYFESILGETPRVLLTRGYGINIWELA